MELAQISIRKSETICLNVQVALQEILTPASLCVNQSALPEVKRVLALSGKPPPIKSYITCIPSSCSETHPNPNLSLSHSSLANSEVK